MLSAQRQERIAHHQAQSQSAYVKDLRRAFASHVPSEYQGHDIKGLTEGKRDWNGALSRDGVVGIARYLKEPTRFLIMNGPTGTGKSSAAYVVGDRLIAGTGKPARFVSAAGMLSAFSFGTGQRTAHEVLTDHSTVPILVIDDLGSLNDGMSDHQRRSLWSLIDSRWSNRLRTIITSNMAINGNREGNGISDLLGESAWDRISDSLTIAPFDGESFRGNKR
jgi:DNA replication protein DnaC